MVPQALPGHRSRPGDEDRQEAFPARLAQGGLCAAGLCRVLDQGDRGDQRPQGPARNRALHAGCRAGPAGTERNRAAAGAEEEPSVITKLPYLKVCKTRHGKLVRYVRKNRRSIRIRVTPDDSGFMPAYRSALAELDISPPVRPSMLRGGVVLKRGQDPNTVQP